MQYWNYAHFIDDITDTFPTFICFHHKILYDADAKPFGAKMNYYSLETSRICASNVSNFHIFYYLLLGSSSVLAKSLHLNAAQTYNVGQAIVQMATNSQFKLFIFFSIYRTWNQCWNLLLSLPYAKTSMVLMKIWPHLVFLTVTKQPYIEHYPQIVPVEILWNISGNISGNIS